MLIVSIPDLDGFDEETGTFVSMPGGVLHLEHNLVALSKWESITHKHLIGNDKVTPEEMALYIKCMITDEEYDPSLLDRIPPPDQRLHGRHDDRNHHPRYGWRVWIWRVYIFRTNLLLDDRLPDPIRV